MDLWQHSGAVKKTYYCICVGISGRLNVFALFLLFLQLFTSLVRNWKDVLKYHFLLSVG